MKSLTSSLGTHPMLLSFPQGEWISLRTPNITEKPNRESKTRTKPMAVVAGEDACYLSLAFILLKGGAGLKAWEDR